MKTVHAKNSEVQRRWLLIDADNQVLGRMATKVADILRGKTKAIYTPHVDTGDFVVVINAEKVKLTGNKWRDKLYYDHTGYVGGLRERTATTMRERHPDEVIRRAVRGMLPRGPLGYAMFSKLKVYAGAEHPHTAQKPEKISL